MARYYITSHVYDTLAAYQHAARKGSIRPGEYAFIRDRSSRVRFLGVDKAGTGVMTAYTSLNSPKVRARLKDRGVFGEPHIARRMTVERVNGIALSPW